MFRFHKTAFVLSSALFLCSGISAQAANTCAPVHDAYNKMFELKGVSNIKNSGTVNVTQAFGDITSDLYQETCKYVRDELLNGEATSVYSDNFTGKAGNTTGLVWISKKTGATLRQDVDADMGAKGKGHQSIVFTFKN